MSKEPRGNPYVEQYLWLSIKDEFKALLLLLRYQWYMVALFLIGIVALIQHLQPIPPRTVSMAQGQPNSTLEVLGKQYQDYFANHGVTLKLVESRGAIENLDLLKQGKVDIALSQGGAPIDANTGIVTLGSVGYQPLWLFYTGPEFKGNDFFKFLEGKQVYVGVPGSGTRIMTDALLNQAGQLSNPAFKLRDDMSARESVQALKEKKIDAMFLLAGYESGNAQALLQDKDVQIMNFPIAHAIAKHMGFAEVVTLPRGALRFSPPRPTEDLQMVATTTTLLAHQDLHPAIQHLLLRATRDAQQKRADFFSRPGGFPAFIDLATPRSSVAEKYYAKGPPLLDGYLPHWLASFFDTAWFTLATIFAILYPLFRMIPGYRKVLFEIVASSVYQTIFYLEIELYKAANAAEIRVCLEKIEKLNLKIREMWVPKGAKEAYSFVVNSMEILLKRGHERAKVFDAT
jgi:TRAP-type uncharacterized transport system substrate-binding protein